jgi:hypothetical protein
MLSKKQKINKNVKLLLVLIIKNEKLIVVIKKYKINEKKNA